MFLSEVSIKRPVLAMVMSMILVIFGWIGYTRLPVRELPEVEFPNVTVLTTLQGANPEIVEQEVTDPIEEEINTVEGIKQMTSSSTEGASQIVVEFNLDRDIDVAAQDVRDKVAGIRQQLPDDIDEPNIQKLDLDAFPIMWMAVSSDARSQADLTYFADRVLKAVLQKVRGVGSIILGGEKRFAVRVWLDADKLASLELTINDVIDALQEKNVALPSGRIEGRRREFTVKTEGELETIREFNDLIITYRDGVPIRLSEVGHVAEGVEDERNFARYNGQPAVGLGILKQTQANTVEVADAVRRRLSEMDLPPDITVEIAYNQADFIKQSIAEVTHTLVLAGILVVVVIFLFLRNLRGTVIPGIAMAISVIATFAALYAFGFSLNNFTLLGLVLAVGIVVDDAIVMLENCFRHVEQGEDPVTAARRGSSEIAFAIIATTVTLVIVFLPVAFMQGQIGRFFYEFGITVSVAVVISSFTALTLSPMMSSRLLRRQTKHNIVYSKLENGYEWMENHYKNGIRRALRHSVLVLAIGLAAFVAGILAFARVGKEFVASEDRGSFMIQFEGPEGSTIEYTDKYVREIEDILAGHEEVRSFLGAVGLSMGGPSGPNRGVFFVMLTDRDQRRHQDAIIQDLREELAQVTGVNAFPITWTPLSQGEGREFEYVLENADFDQLAAGSQQFAERLRQTPGFVDVDIDLRFNKPQLQVLVDRDKADSFGISVRQIANTLNVMLSGNNYTRFRSMGERYDVILQLEREERLTPEILDRIHLRADDGALVNLSNIVRIEESVGPTSINRFNRMRAATVEANLQGITLAEALQRADELAEDVLPAGFTTGISGQAQEMREAFSSLFFTFLLAIVLIYLVLSAQFESFVYPVSVMAALPLAAIGAIGALLMTGMTVNVYSIIGMIMLLGLATKNSILLVDFTNTLRSRGLGRSEAIEEAGRVRLDPHDHVLDNHRHSAHRPGARGGSGIQAPPRRRRGGRHGDGYSADTLRRPRDVPYDGQSHRVRHIAHPAFHTSLKIAAQCLLSALQNPGDSDIIRSYEQGAECG